MIQLSKMLTKLYKIDLMAEMQHEETASMDNSSFKTYITLRNKNAKPSKS